MFSPTQAQIAVVVLSNSGQVEQARKVIRQAESSIQPELHCTLAASLAGEREYEKALAEYKAAFQLAPGFAPAINGMVKIFAALAANYLQKRDWQQALHYAKNALTLAPDNTEIQNLASIVEISGALEGCSLENPEDMINAVEKIYLANPARLELAHKLAMLYHQQAIDLEGNSKDSQRLEETWEKAIAYWSLVMGGDDYWEKWFSARESIYDEPIPPEKREDLRKNKIKEQIRQVHQNFIREYAEAGQNEQVNRHRVLLARWSLEMSTADAVKQMFALMKAKKIPAPLPAACGPNGWSIFGARDDVEKAVKSILKLDPANEAAGLVMDGLTSIGMANALRKEGLLREAVDTLKKYIARPFSDARGRALLGEMLIEQGQTMAGSDLEGAIVCWVEAKRYVANANQIDEIITQAVYKQADYLSDNGETQKALSLLKIGIENVSTGSSMLRDFYAKLLVHEAFQMFEKVEKEGNLDKTKRAINKIRKMLQDGDKVAGPNHPAIKENLEGLNQILANIMTGQAIEMVNEVTEQYGKGSKSFDDTIRILNEAMATLEEANRLLPGTPTILKHVADLNGLRIKIRENEAGHLNQTAVNMAGAAMESAKKGQRYNAADQADQALAMLEKARSLAPDNKTIRENFVQISALREAIRQLL